MKINLNNYKEILRALDLPSFWEQRLKSKKLKNEGTALRILDDMSKEASSNAISARAASHNDNLRKHAKSIYMKFDSNDAFKFLDDDFDKDFNSLDEIRIHDALKNRSKIRALPQLIRWVSTAKNEYYKRFLIQEIGFFKQIEAAGQLIAIFQESHSSMIKSQICKTLGELNYSKAIPLLIEEFNYNTLEVQNSIINAMGMFGGLDALNFLEEVYHETHNKETLIKVLHNIYNIDKTKMVFNKLQNKSSTDFEKSIFAHIEQGYSVL